MDTIAETAHNIAIKSSTVSAASALGAVANKPQTLQSFGVSELIENLPLFFSGLSLMIAIISMLVNFYFRYKANVREQETHDLKMKSNRRLNNTLNYENDRRK